MKTLDEDTLSAMPPAERSAVIVLNKAERRRELHHHRLEATILKRRLKIVREYEAAVAVAKAAYHEAEDKDNAR